jgi:hypothetical protein
MNEEGAYPRMEIGAQPRRAGGRGRGVPRKKEASPENQPGLGDKGTKGQSELGWFVGVGRGPKGTKGGPRERGGIRVTQQATGRMQGEIYGWICRVSTGRDRQSSKECI